MNAPTVGPNPAALLPARRAYPAATRVARFVSPPYAQYAKLILKVSHNLGANLSLMYAGLTEGARTRAAALAVERRTLVSQVRHSRRRLRLPDQRQRQPGQPGDAGAR